MEVKQYFVKNAPALMTGAAAGMTVATGIFAWRGGSKAEHLLAEIPEDSSKIEKIKYTWKAWSPAVFCGVAAISFAIGAHVGNAKKQAALGSALSATAGYLNTYKDEVKKVLTDDQKTEVEENVVKTTMPPPPVNTPIPVHGHGGTLCYDALSGRYFLSSMEAIRKAQNDFNQSIIGGTFGTLNEFYSYLELSPIILGGEVGWEPEKLMDISFTTMIAENGEPVLVIDHHNIPMPERIY